MEQAALSLCNLEPRVESFELETNEQARTLRPITANTDKISRRPAGVCRGILHFHRRFLPFEKQKVLGCFTD
jgi:hypothetical protein